ncbi:MAG: DUF3343 domain-containing protein [Desulfuromonadales bacterium]|nr:DUF3343 domain-containing protein [Desulfuromonadales bacterium]
MVNPDDFVAIFHSIHKVLKAEKLLKQAGVRFLLIPVPRQLTSDCGLALRFAPADRTEFWAVLEAAGLLPVELHQFRDDRFVAVGLAVGETADSP